MSALGQKQTFAVQNGMSALPPKADIDCYALVSSTRRISPIYYKYCSIGASPTVT